MSRWLQLEFEDVFPLSFLMRQRYPQWWLRIHSLPESKRYPDDDSEREIVFQRYVSFGTALLGADASCLFIRSGGAIEEMVSEFERSLTWVSLPAVEEDGNHWSSWMAEVRWNPEMLRSLLLDVAEDRDRHLLLVSKTTDAIFAPYDGGADGFSFDLHLLTRLRQEFAPWLSRLPSGL